MEHTQIRLPISKSLYIRKLIYDFLYHKKVDDIPSDAPADVCVVRHALAIISKSLDASSSPSEPVLVDVCDCGAAYRFLMAVLAVTPGQWQLTGNERLLHRPIKELVQALCSIGADIQWNGVSWFIHGKNLHAEEMTIDCSRSGQFASALLLISGRIGLQNLHVLPENPPSAPYINMTKAVMAGKARLEANCMADWSAAVYWYARLLLSSQPMTRNAKRAVSVDVSLPKSYKLLQLDLASIQGDAVLASWFAAWGVESRQEQDGVCVFYNQNIDFQSDVIELEMAQQPDLVPVLACMACLWGKTMVFNNVANLKYKESDRLRHLREQLSPYATIEVNEYQGIIDNQLIVRKKEAVVYPENLFFDAHDDHRLVMAFALFALRCPVTIQGFESVGKSYPNFKAEGVIAGTDIVR